MKSFLLLFTTIAVVCCTNRQINTSTIDPITAPDIDTSILSGLQPKSLLELPQTQDGEIILQKGYYEAVFKSYCLQPGTPDPRNTDAYTQYPLTGYRHEIVESILRKSLQYPELDQKNIQLLLWSTVSGSDYQKLPSTVKQTARTMLTQKELFTLQGGVGGVVKNVGQYIPELNNNSFYSGMRQLFDLGNSSYEAYEQIAVLRTPSIKNGRGYPRERWYKQPEGYYVRYFPRNYQQTTVQIYVPDELRRDNKQDTSKLLLFDPVSLMAVPTNSNAQRLGIGAPMEDIVRQIIFIEKNIPKKGSGKPKKTTTQSPKGIPMD
jgi:hypothetical protein